MHEFLLLDYQIMDNTFIEVNIKDIDLNNISRLVLSNIEQDNIDTPITELRKLRCTITPGCLNCKYKKLPKLGNFSNIQEEGDCNITIKNNKIQSILFKDQTIKNPELKFHSSNDLSSIVIEYNGEFFKIIFDTQSKFQNFLERIGSKLFKDIKEDIIIVDFQLESRKLERVILWIFLDNVIILYPKTFMILNSFKLVSIKSTIRTIEPLGGFEKYKVIIISLDVEDPSKIKEEGLIFKTNKGSGYSTIEEVQTFVKKKKKKKKNYEQF